jgi:hypothetical protein
LQNFEIEEEITPIILTEEDIKEQEFTPIDIFNLEGIISFE